MVRRKPTHRDFLDAPVLGIVLKIKIHLYICYAKKSTRCCITMRFGEKADCTHIAAPTVPKKAAPMVLPNVTGMAIGATDVDATVEGMLAYAKKESTEERATHLK